MEKNENQAAGTDKCSGVTVYIRSEITPVSKSDEQQDRISSYEKRVREWQELRLLSFSI